MLSFIPTRIFLCFMSLSLLVGKESFTYVYVLPFDNIKNDSALDWVSSGLSDMVREEIKNIYGVRLKNREDLETIMNDRSLMLKQPRGSRNLLVLGKYVRQLDRINVTVQIVDVANWEEIGKTNISNYSKIQVLNTAVGRAVLQIIVQLDNKAKSSQYPKYTQTVIKEAIVSVKNLSQWINR